MFHQTFFVNLISINRHPEYSFSHFVTTNHITSLLFDAVDFDDRIGDDYVDIILPQTTALANKTTNTITFNRIAKSTIDSTIRHNIVHLRCHRNILTARNRHGS